MEKIQHPGAIGRYFAEAVASAGHDIIFRNGECWVSNAAAVNAIIATYNPGAEALARKLTEVKVEAKRRITAFFPEWKQTNMIARGVELQDMWRRAGAWTAKEQEDADALQSAWDAVQAIRIKSDAIEATIAALADHEAIERFDVTADSIWR